ncbi:MAG TPA: thioredoxin family protein [Gaiellaceae bacterium]|nr:thioredoxin family protein [Gaiellaceae bacterium]
MTPIQYHVPTPRQCSDGRFTQPPAGTHRENCDPEIGRIMHDDARPLLVFFSSSRSGPARRMESLLAHVARKERHRLRVIQVDVDQRRDLAQRLDVAEAPTLVLVVGKRAVARLEGRTSAPRIDALLNAHLAEPVEV